MACVQVLRVLSQRMLQTSAQHGDRGRLSLGRAAASGVFATGCLIGAAEGVPKTAKALSSLTKRS